MSPAKLTLTAFSPTARTHRHYLPLSLQGGLSCRRATSSRTRDAIPVRAGDCFVAFGHTAGARRAAAAYDALDDIVQSRLFIDRNWQAGPVR
jgi:hypothetical protein